MPSPPYVDRLLFVVGMAEPRLLALSDAASATPRAPGKWCPREIIGHLIDSASHNHQRFVRARWQDDLVFDGYTQDDWVAAQGYRESPWRPLVTLWAEYNRHIARVMSFVPGDVRTRVHEKHNLDQMAWRALPDSQAATLDFFMDDYVAHLEHHLRQALGDSWLTEASRA